MHADGELLIGSIEAAEILGVDRATVLRWVANGKLTALRQLPGANGAFLFDAALIRRKATERLLERRAS